MFGTSRHPAGGLACSVNWNSFILYQILFQNVLGLYKQESMEIWLIQWVTTRSTRPIDAKLWKKLCLQIMYNIKIFLYQTPPYQRSKIYKIFWNIIYNISQALYLIDRIDLHEIIGNWKFWIIWNLCDKIFIFSIFVLRYF